jgi:hypothetical protein
MATLPWLELLICSLTRHNLIAIGFRLVCFNSPDLLQECSRPKSRTRQTTKKPPEGGCFWLRELDLNQRPSGYELEG